MAKRLVKISVSFGKGDGEEVREQFLMEDTPENRKELLDDYMGMFSECYEKEEFIEGEADVVYIALDGGDWDDPTGRFIALYDKEELLSEIENEYKKKVFEVERLFKELR